MDKLTPSPAARRRALLGLFAACALVCAALWLYLGYTGFDLVGHWTICRYTLLGENPYPWIGVDGPLGRIPPGFSTVPWSCFLGSVFYGGFLPLEYVWIYNLLLHLVGGAVTAWALCRAARPLAGGREWVLIALAVCAHFSFAYSILCGNAGGILCCGLMLSILLAEKRPWLSGILLSLAMVKPQVAAVVCVIFLLNRRWKALFFAAAIDIAAWAVTCLLTDTGPVTLLAQTFSSGTASEGQYLGLMSVLRFFGVNSTLILLMNMVLGVAYAVGGWLYLRRRCPGERLSPAVYIPACIASTFWMYKNGTDYSLLSFAVVFFLLLALKAPMSRRDFVLAFGCIGYWMLSRCGVYLGVAIFDSPLAADLFKSADGLLIALAGVIFCRMWVRWQGESLLPEGMKQSR